MLFHRGLIAGVSLEDARRENSPSLCPTMFSVMNTGMCALPLWTLIV